jgi:hypothetical protein
MHLYARRAIDRHRRRHHVARGHAVLPPGVVMHAFTVADDLELVALADAAGLTLAVLFVPSNGTVIGAVRIGTA